MTAEHGRLQAPEIRERGAAPSNPTKPSGTLSLLENREEGAAAKSDPNRRHPPWTTTRGRRRRAPGAARKHQGAAPDRHHAKRH